MFRRRGQTPSPPPASSVPVAASTSDLEAAEDERLARAARDGDLPSFNALVARHERAVFGLCLRMLREPDAAEDAAQETFIRAWSALGSFQGGLFRSWLLRIASNRCLDILRAKGRRPADSLDALTVESEPSWSSQSAAEHPAAFADRAELSRRLESALATLPDEQRLVVLLSDVHGHSYDEVAKIAGIAVGTVKSRLSRARARLRDALLENPADRELFERFQRLSENDEPVRRKVEGSPESQR